MSANYRKKLLFVNVEKKYKFQSGLSKHKHKCKFVFEEKLQITTTEKDKEIQLLKAELADLKLQQEQDKSVILEAVNTMAKNHSELTEATKKIAENGGAGNNYTDCYNQKMTINVFLNEVNAKML